MTDKLSKTYNPQEHEERIYQWCEEQGYFRPEKQVELGLVAEDGPRWCITMPPPNVTGALHLGHAMVAALEDLMTRYYRMRGFETLFLPGSDHAGIATQNVVERELAKEGVTRHDLGREKFIAKVWEWKDVYHRRITDQTKRLGVSCDWMRERFTLDEGLSHAVRSAFTRLYKKGLIYRGTYLVNWCPRCESAISDLEVIPDERASHLWHIRYPIINDDWNEPQEEWGSGKWASGATEFIEMATTRPETILGDTAVAVNPGDPRWQRLVGQIAILPALNRHIPIIADEAVDPEFGSGAVKVTPAHDPNDNEIGLRHGLEAPNIMTDTAQMNKLAGPYAGQDRFECRENIVADFEKEGLLVKIESYVHAVGTCERCHTDIEPRISTQWFVNAKPLAEAAMEAVRDGSTTIIPEREERRFFHWMENIRPWCISRQLWWGHRIPVWYCDDCGEQTCEIDDPAACTHCGSANIHQDEDVLDTWFSSGLWPFSTLGWPDTESPDYKRFYPTDVRETAYEILFFWVAREMMLGIELTGQTPYATVYLHGLVRNEEGKKVSKSMEDIEEYDPLNIIEKYGSDALRYTQLTSSTPGLDMSLDPRRLEGARNFTNKIWQAARFVLSNLGDGPATLSPASRLLLPDRWILSRLNSLIQSVERLFESYQYGEAGRQIHDFLWGEYCDWYIEASKVRLYDETAEKSVLRAVLLHVLETSLRLLHPFMPFVTEAIWQALPDEVRKGESLMMAQWPEPDAALLDGAAFAKAEEQMGLMMELVRGIRNRRAEYNVTPGKRITALIAAGDESGWLDEQRAVLCSLAKLDSKQLTIQPAIQPPDQAAVIVVGEAVCYLPLAALVDLDAERERLSKVLDEIKGRVARSEGLLAGEFAQKAPEHVVQRERDKLAGLQAERAKLVERLAALEQSDTA
ncbi:MAG: valine--tRNA ligase [Chloroflexi bacterium]|nr:MAG: valine--tRNA ligase [Anaerolineaceae bacterium 4572_32.2]RLC74182.1 MAG: valine--tRNA ligase [Chloroflexota bacterium]RLC82853.1 MAG: valine--tRNA ligase [Chloroflexota bacterium]